VLAESEVSASAGVVIKVGMRSGFGFESRLLLIVDVVERTLTDVDGVAAVEWTLLRGFGDIFDSNDRSERSRLLWGDAALTSLDRKLGAMAESIDTVTVHALRTVQNVE